MAENAAENANTGQEATLAVVAVPEQQIQQVIDFVNSLESDESAVSGHAFSRVSTGMGAGRLAAGAWTGTGCGVYTTGSTGQDYSCADSDG